MSKRTLGVLSFFLVGLVAAGQVQAADKSRSAGFVDFNSIKAIKNMPAEVDITLDGWLMGLVGQAAKESGENDLDWMQAIDSVRVKVIPLTKGDDAKVLAAASKVVKKLIDDGWENVVSVREEGQQVNVFVLGDGDHLTGVTIVVVDSGDEAVFVNLSGNISSRHLSALMSGQNIPGLGINLWDLRIDRDSEG